MKIKISHRFPKKVVTGIFAIVLIVIGACVLSPKENEVIAADTYTGDSYEGTEVSNTYWGKKIPTPQNEKYTGWLFAGWMDAEGNSVSSVDIDSTYYAKFVDPEVLSVKAQVTEGVTAESEHQTANMRLISTVDGMDYNGAGFEVYYDVANQENNDKTTDYGAAIETVYQRIEAGSKSKVAFKYSPKVFNTDSEHFMTYTLLGIKRDNFGKVFLIKPYWITKDGLKVHGVSRYVTVSDSYSNIANIPVYADSENEVSAYATATVGITSNEVAIEGVAVAQDGYYYDSETKWANLRVKITGADALPSASTISATIGDTEYKVIHRNLETTYAPVDEEGNAVETYSPDFADKTWYSEYILNNPDETEFVIATDADLYGFANIDTTDFYEKTIYLVSDIVANNGEASSTAWTPATTDGTAYNWMPIIGSGSFGGTFDGQMHSISGICVKEAPSNGFIGLFAYVNGNGTIKNVELKNSYFYATTQMVGSITAKGTGTYVNIKSSAHINATVVAGGFIGQVNHGTKTQISNCWFAGTVSTSNQYVGGIVGNSVKKGLIISDCLNTGKISSTNTAPFIGGVFGAHGSSSLSATISNCLNIGEISTSNATTTGYIGQIYGGNNKTSTMTITNSYGTKERNANLVGSNKNAITYAEGSPEVAEITMYGITGYGAFHSTNLDFVNNWAVQDGTTPVPKAFAVDELNTIGITKADVNWYNEGIAITDDNEEITGYTYNIDNAEELFGLGVIVNNAIDDFAGDIVEITADIDLNNGWENTFDISTNSPKAPAEATNKWIPIGCVTYSFKGVFGGASDGNIKKISGLYIKRNVDDGYDVGLFGHTSNCTIQNIALTNSYINTSVRNSNTGTGCIIGCGDGNIYNVYTDADIYGVNAMQLAGIIGMITDGDDNASTEVNILNCWYDGNIVVRSNDMVIHNIAGLIGYAKFGTITLSNTLFTGVLNYKTGAQSDQAVTVNGPYIGGVIARDNSVTKIDISSCLSAGTIQITPVENVTFKQIASIVGRHNTKGTLDIASSFTTISTEELPIVLNTSNAVVDKGVEVVTNWDSNVTGLDKEYWQLDSNATIPVLKNLVDYTDNWAVLP